jgi:tRNA(fMet)-specific endonuclease VapC
MNSDVFMLDTNIVSDLVRNPRGRVQHKLRHHGINAVCLSAVAVSEIRFGLIKRGSGDFTNRVENALSRISILNYGEESSVAYASIRHDLQSRGAMIGSTDLFIAAHAKSLDLTLVTNNVREFSRIEGLKVENWLEEETGR